MSVEMELQVVDPVLSPCFRRSATSASNFRWSARPVAWRTSTSSSSSAAGRILTRVGLDKLIRRYERLLD
jgi:hypothetical protein